MIDVEAGIGKDLFWGFWFALHLLVWLFVLWKRAERRRWRSFVANLFPPIAIWSIWSQIWEWIGQFLTSLINAGANSYRDHKERSDESTQRQLAQERAKRFIRVYELETKGIGLGAACEAEGVDQKEYVVWRDVNVNAPES